MNTDQFFLEELSGTSISMDAPAGYCVWQWNSTTWSMIQDFSKSTGIPQSPIAAGSFVGQLRAVVCRSKASMDA
jgi:hypothetical protein